MSACVHACMHVCVKGLSRVMSAQGLLFGGVAVKIEFDVNSHLYYFTMLTNTLL